MYFNDQTMIEFYYVNTIIFSKLGKKEKHTHKHIK